MERKIKKFILIADDNDAIAELLQAMCNEAGFATTDSSEWNRSDRRGTPPTPDLIIWTW